MDIKIWSTKVDTDTILQGTNAHVLYLVSMIQKQCVLILLDGGICVQNNFKKFVKMIMLMATPALM